MVKYDGIHQWTLDILLILSLTRNLVGMDISSQGAEEDLCNGNYAVAIYQPTQSFILSSFYEEQKTFRFKNIEDDIIIVQDWNKHGVAAVVWEAAVELGRYISDNISISGADILELGAGTGLAGIVCSKLGAQVTVTDLSDALPFLSKNVDLNFADGDENRPKVEELEWGNGLQAYTPCQYDYIIGADVIYNEDTFDDLFETLCHLSGVGPQHETTHKHCNKKMIILLSCKMRYTREARFIERMRKYFNIDEIVKNTDNNVHIFKAVPKRLKSNKR